MTKKELIEELQKRSELPSKTMAEKVIKDFISIVKEVASAGDSLQFKEFGTFKAHTKKDRNGVNPNSGEKIKIAGYTTIKFKPSKEFRW